jgi:hypothetical protein
MHVTLDGTGNRLKDVTVNSKRGRQLNIFLISIYVY